MTEYWQLSLIKQYLGEAEGCCNSLVPFITWWRPLDHVINRRHVKQVGCPYDEEIYKYHGWGEWRSDLFTAQSLYMVPDLVLWSFSLSWHRFQNQFHLSYYREVERIAEVIECGQSWCDLDLVTHHLRGTCWKFLQISHINNMEESCAPSGFVTSVQVTVRDPSSLLPFCLSASFQFHNILLSPRYMLLCKLSQFFVEVDETPSNYTTKRDRASLPGYFETQGRYCV